MSGLRDYPFQISYGPGDDRLHHFYIGKLFCSLGDLDTATSCSQQCKLPDAFSAKVDPIFNHCRVLKLLVWAGQDFQFQLTGRHSFSCKLSLFELKST